VQGVINTLLVILFNLLFLIVFDLGVTGYVLSVACADFAVFILVFCVEKLCLDLVPFSQVSKRLWKDMLRYSIPLIPNTIFWWIISVSDRYMVSAMVGQGANGLYTAAYKIPTLITLICQVFAQAWTYSSVVEDDKEQRSDFFSKVFTFYLAILFVGASGIILFSKLFTGLLYHESFYASWQYIPVLTLATVFSSLVTFMGSVYTVSKKSLPAMLTVTAGAVVNIVLNFLLIPSELGGISLPGLGALGAAIATLISYMVVFGVRAATSKQHVDFDMHLPLLFTNSVLVGTQAVLMVIEVPLWWLFESILLTAVLAINGKALLPYMKKMLSYVKKREKS
jgi:O-antigen/teichoic acid export membrane protein